MSVIHLKLSLKEVITSHEISKDAAVKRLHWGTLRLQDAGREAAASAWAEPAPLYRESPLGLIVRDTL